MYLFIENNNGVLATSVYHKEMSDVRPMSVQNFSSIGSTLVKILAKFDPDREKPYIFGFT